MNERGDKIQAKIGQLWEDEISKRRISRALQKIGFTTPRRSPSGKADFRCKGIAIAKFSALTTKIQEFTPN
ncbi:hypothetical protein [Nostoc sp.]|uniref:hypothetical protein n=1 Tax=Nostoc sp. TaxID=1180 RepID=UPI002FFC392C